MAMSTANIQYAPGVGHFFPQNKPRFAGTAKYPIKVKKTNRKNQFGEIILSLDNIIESLEDGMSLRDLNLELKHLIEADLSSIMLVAKSGTMIGKALANRFSPKYRRKTIRDIKSKVQAAEKDFLHNRGVVGAYTKTKGVKAALRRGVARVGMGRALSKLEREKINLKARQRYHRMRNKRR